MNHDTYRKIVSGQDHRPWIGVLRVLLGAVSVIYGLVMRGRNLLFTIGILRSHRAGVPVVSIGNITTGGTGKTPLVIWLCGYLRNKGLHSSILTRGYKTQPDQITDEPALLARACPDTDVIVNPNRLAGAQKAISSHQAQALVLDDGFQHRRLKRDLDIVAVDATCPFGYGRVLPAGLLREPKGGLSRADAVIITRFDQADAKQMRQLEQDIQRIVPDIPIAKAAHKHTGAVTFQNEKLDIEELRSKKIFAFCGIGNPNAFFRCLEQCGLSLAGTQIFDDHHAYTRDEMKQILEQARSCGAEVILCTQKDWVKSALLSPENENVVSAYLTMELDFLDGLDKITSLIDNLFTGPTTENETTSE
ncbi:MAG: tetraacyldisaccharide 4'-kinase [Planctomycetota bacterium]